DIVGLANGGFVATWRTTDALADGSDQAVKAQIFDTSGAKLGAEFLVNSQTNGSQYDPNIAALANGGFVVTWYTTDAAQDGNGGAIKGQMFSASGARIGGEFLVNTQSANTQREPFATGLPDGGFMVTWSTLDTMQDGSGSAIKAQVFDASGVKIGGELLVNTLAAGGQFLPDIATLADGRVVVTWTSDNGDGSGFALRARILAPNTAPDITSDGGDASASVAADENQTAVTSVAATDLGGPSPVTYAISGGADAALFAIDPVTGALRFVTERDFENAADANGDGVYDVIVSAGDGELTSTQALSVSIVNVNEGLTITSGAAVSIGENGTAVSTVTASDIDGDAPSFAIGGGADAGFFAIDAGTGAISFVNAPNFEAPGDADGDNVYDVIVSATDGDFVTTQAIAISVGNVDEAVTITSDGGGDGAALSIAENGTAVTTVTAIDVDGSLVSYAVTGGGDAALFTIDAQTGALSFLTSPDFEAPADADGNNVYDVIVSATDGTFSDAQALAVTVTNAREGNTIIGTSGSNIISTTNSPTGQPRATELEDTIYGLGGGDTIRAAGGDDIIDGGSGNDMITGGTGADIITGGTGADRFIYNSVSESSAGAVDIIADFSRSQGDRISLSPIDANSGAWGNQGFNFIGTAAFSGVAGQLRYEQANGNTFVAGDVDGDGVADLQIQLNGLIDLRSTDFLL
ncbi:MAG: cadherin domain-containing protein, partial [Sphingomonadaceae bacterium]